MSAIGVGWPPTGCDLADEKPFGWGPTYCPEVDPSRSAIPADRGSAHQRDHSVPSEGTKSRNSDLLRLVREPVV